MEKTVPLRIKDGRIEVDNNTSLLAYDNFLRNQDAAMYQYFVFNCFLVQVASLSNLKRSNMF